MTDKNTEHSEADKKIVRHKRRVRSQIIAYVSFVILVAGVAIGGIYGVNTLGTKFYEMKVAKQEEAESIAASEAEAESADEEIPLVEETVSEEEESVPETTEYTEEELLEEVVNSCIEDMPLEDKVAGLFIVTPESLTGVDKAVKAGDGTKEALEKYPVGGIIYFAQNIQSESQIKEMVDNTVSYSKYPLFIAVDEEGGRIARLQSSLKLEATDSPQVLAEAGDDNAVYDTYSLIGERLASYGFNLDFAPVADVLTNEANKVIGDRSFGSDTEVVIKNVTLAVQGLRAQGISACVKHFPGQGSVGGDTHEGMASTDRSAEDMKNTDIPPFTSGIAAGADMVMVGHFICPSLTEDDTTPCSLSKAVMTDLLRGECGYNGVIITDALSMTAISEYHSSDEAAVKALKAGADMLLMPEDFEAAYNGVLEAVKDGTIDEQRINDSLARVYRVKYRSTVEN